MVHARIRVIQHVKVLQNLPDAQVAQGDALATVRAVVALAVLVAVRAVVAQGALVIVPDLAIIPVTQDAVGHAIGVVAALVMIPVRATVLLDVQDTLKVAVRQVHVLDHVAAIAIRLAKLIVTQLVLIWELKVHRRKYGIH